MKYLMELRIQESNEGSEWMGWELMTIRQSRFD